MTIDPLALGICAALGGAVLAVFFVYLAEWRPGERDEIPTPPETIDATKWGRR